jgi:hypothetical protein
LVSDLHLVLQEVLMVLGSFRRTLVLLSVTGLLPLALRASNVLAAELAQPSAPLHQAATGQNPPFELAYIPRDAVLVCATRPAALLEREPFVRWRDGLLQAGGPPLGISPDEVVEFAFALLPGLDPEPAMVFVLRTSTAAAAQRFVASLGSDAQPRDFAGQTYYRFASRAGYFQPDPQTVVFSPQESTLVRCVVAGPTGATTTNWHARWTSIAGQDAAVVVNTSLLRAVDITELVQSVDLLSGGRSRKSPAGAQLAFQLAPLWRRSEHILADVQVDNGITLRIISQSACEDEAREVHTALLTAVAVVRTALSRSRGALAADPSADGAALLRYIDLADEMVEKAQVVRRDTMTGIVARMDEDRASRITQWVPPALAAAQTANSRAQSQNHLKQIALAFHHYHDTYGRFPAAVQLGRKNTPRSWRVTLLPFLGQSNLHDQYREEEPWDSVNNRRVLAKMPAVFRHPSDDPRSTNASYFALVGPDTVFPGNQAVKIAEITDGTSNTLLVVESKQETPWTKPEDIPFDAQQPLPRLGGWYPQGFHAAMCDGSVRFLDQATDEQILRFLIMRADGSPIRPPP